MDPKQGRQSLCMKSTVLPGKPQIPFKVKAPASCSAMSDPLRPHRMSPTRSDGIGWVSACLQNPAHPIPVLLCFQNGPFFSIPPAHTSLAILYSLVLSAPRAWGPDPSSVAPRPASSSSQSCPAPALLHSHSFCYIYDPLAGSCEHLKTHWSAL